MLTEEGFAFFHRTLSRIANLRLHPFTLRNGLLAEVESKRTHLIGWASIILNILYLPLVVYRIRESGRIEGMIHSFLILGTLAALTGKITILKYHSELIQIVNNVLLLNRKLGKTKLRLIFHSFKSDDAQIN